MRQSALVLTFLLSGTAFAADSQLMNLVMPDARILAGANTASSMASPLGQFVLAKIGLIGQIQRSFAAATGFDPVLDVSEVLAATTADPSNPGGLVMARGTFPVDKITALSASPAAGGSANWQVSSYGGATLLSSATNAANKVAYGVAFIGNSVAVAGDLASVKAAIDRSGGTNSIDPGLLATVNQLSGGQDEWLASVASLASLMPAAPPSDPSAPNPAAAVLPLLKSIQSFNGGVKFGDNVTVTGEAVANGPQNAAALQAVIKLGVTLGAQLTANAPGNPQVGELVALLQTLQVTANGSAVDLSLSIPEAQIEGLVNSLPAPVKPVAAVRESPDAHNGN